MIPLKKIDITKVLFLDIETVPQFANHSELPELLSELWSIKALKLAKNGELPEEIYSKAGIFAEFGKIVCISVGVCFYRDNVLKCRIKSFAGYDEAVLLNDFVTLLNDFYKTDDNFLCAHNGKEFDFPFLARRMVVNRIDIPLALDVRGAKPWETPFIDTMDLWRFGDYKSYTSLKLLTTILGIPSPKDDIDGSMVCNVYWKEKDLQRIEKYCRKDVWAIINLFLRYANKEIVSEDNIENV